MLLNLKSSTSDINIKSSIFIEEYLQTVGMGGLSFVELFPMGRAAYSLEYLFQKYPAEQFFGESCKDSLTRDWHVHIDNYGNYLKGYCGGLSLGDARDLDSICDGIDLEEHRILEPLVTCLEKLYVLCIKGLGYRERKEDYNSECHLCLDIRKTYSTANRQKYHQL